MLTSGLMSVVAYKSRLDRAVVFGLDQPDRMAEVCSSKDACEVVGTAFSSDSAILLPGSGPTLTGNVEQMHFAPQHLLDDQTHQ